MDSMHGELLIYRVKENSRIDKEVLFEWMRQLLNQVLQFHQCHNNQNYKYLNPYSVFIARDGRILLLDLEAESNEFVLKNLQKRAMRAHFIKPIAHIGESAGDALDLYGYGKTLQFILANTIVEPSLTRIQENKLEKIINKCLNENPGKQYKELKQIERELPVVRDRKIWEEKKQTILSAAAAVSIIVCFGCSALSYNLMRQQKNMKNVILELQRLQSEEVDEFSTEDIKIMIDTLESELREEIGYTEESIAGLSESLEQHIADEKAKAEQEDLEEKVADETTGNVENESENVVKEESTP